MYSRISLVFLQESRVEGARQQIGHVKLLALPIKICKHDLRASRKLPNDLTTRSARRRQSFSVCNNSKVCELAFTFRQRLPDRDALRTNSQTVTRTLDVAAGVNLAVRGPHCCTDKEIRKRRH